MEHDLRERLKELTCLRRIQHLLDGEPTVDDLCREVTALLPPAMQFPDVARATVVLDGHTWGEPAGPSATGASLGADIVAAGTVRGRLTVRYATDLPFILPEEQNLLDSIAHSVGLWLDHSESEAMLRASEARHRHIFEAAGTGLWEEDFSGVWEMLDELRAAGIADLRQHLVDHPDLVASAARRLKVLHVNRAVLGMLRIDDPGDPTAFERVLSHIDLEVFREEMIALAEGRRRFETETVGRTLDGEALHLWLTLNVPESRHEPVVVSTVDITPRKRAEVALRTAEALYQTVFDVSLDGLAVFDPQFRIVLANRRSAEMSGYDRPEELYGRKMIELIAPEDRQRVVRETLAQLESGVAAGEGLGLRRDGTTFPAEFALVRLPAGEGESAGMLVGVSRDITARRRAEEALAEERNSLAHRVAERTAALSRVNAELAQAVRAKDEFLASMSHELRTPLNAILALSEGLLEQIRGPLNERQEASLRTIESSGHHLLSLINDILDLSKIEAGRLETQLEEVSLAEVCEASLAFVRETARKKGLQIAVRLNDQLARVQADPKRLKQMLVNLLSNAVKFTEPGGRVSLEVERDPREEIVRFAVSDSGIGISTEGMARLFQPFTQLDSSLSRLHEGSGLGLALVRRLAELHGGSITVESQVGVGSRFVLTLPDRPAPASAAPAVARPEEAPAPAPPPRSALLVEDSESAAEQLCRYLGEIHVHSVVHPQGEGAVAAACRFGPDLIFLDLLLPDLSGWEVLSQLKSDPRARGIPVVIASVLDERARGLAAGAAEFLVKPVSRDALRHALAAVATGGRGAHEALVIARPPVPPSTGLRILLAEDNEVNIRAVGDYLEDRGFQVSVARNGREAVERAAEVRPDVILMDIQMPEVDGLEATRRLRGDRATAAIPIIALTALAMPGDRERCLAAGADEYLTKPVRLKGLVDRIERLAHRKATDETPPTARPQGSSAAGAEPPE